MPRHLWLYSGTVRVVACWKSEVRYGGSRRQRKKAGEEMSDEDKSSLLWVINLMIGENDKFLFDEGDVCYCIVTHKFKNEK